MCAFLLGENQGAHIGTELDTVCNRSSNLHSNFQNMLFGSAFLLRKVETQELLDGCLSTFSVVPKEGKIFCIGRHRGICGICKNI